MAEARLYLGVLSCSACRGGPLHPVAEVVEAQHIDSIVRVDCRCASCGHPRSLRFRIDSEWLAERQPPVLNPGAAPSVLVDVGQWLTIYHTLLDEAARDPDRQAARLRFHQAGLCLDEALKFFESDNDLPPAGAFFAAQTRERALGQPQLFTRQRLLALRARLPNLASSPGTPPSPAAPRKWWEFWKPRAAKRSDPPPRP